MKKMLLTLLVITSMLGPVAVTSAQDYKTPYVTDKTVYIYKKVPFSSLQPVSDGKFMLLEYNPDFGYGSYWGSWTIDGKQIYAPEWEQFSREKPMWDSGVCVLKDPKAKIPVILYAERRIKEFRNNCGLVSQFVDGIAMVVESLEDGNVSYYINPAGEKVYTHLEEKGFGYRAAAVVRPVKDGLRAYYSNTNQAWGYLDAAGNVVIEAKYHDVRDFANGYALVILKQSFGLVGIKNFLHGNFGCVSLGSGGFGCRNLGRGGLGRSSFGCRGFGGGGFRGGASSKCQSHAHQKDKSNDFFHVVSPVAFYCYKNISLPYSAMDYQWVESQH